MRLFAQPAETIEGVGREIRAGRVSCVEVVRRCLDRIKEIDSQLRAWVLVDTGNALASAEALDEELRAGNNRGPLHGIPIGVKDIIDVAGLPTAAGFDPWRDRIAAQDAPVVARLRTAGAVILGKTVTTQHASFDPPPTRNPWDHSRTPGGSSSGSAAAVATGMCLVALGSQTGGSITRPASYCGVAGCKPTRGLISLNGVRPLAPTLDHVGPIARTVRDLGRVMVGAAGPIPTSPPVEHNKVAEVIDRSNGNFEPPTLCRLRGLFDDHADPEIKSLLDNVLGKFTRAGAVVTEFDDKDGLFSDHVLQTHKVIIEAECAAQHFREFEQSAEAFGPKITGQIEAGSRTLAINYIAALQRRIRIIERVSQWGDWDAWITPATTGPAPDCSTTGDPAMNSPWSLTGLPVISLPMGLSEEGLPLAFQVIGRHYSEDKLFETALWCEQVLAHNEAAGEP